MNCERLKSGLTLVEALIAVAIVAVLTVGFFVVSNRARTQAQIQVTKSLLATLDTALQQYYDAAQKYPPDCNSLIGGQLVVSTADVQTKLMTLDPLTTVSILPSDDLSNVRYKDQRYFSIAAAYYYLCSVPESKLALQKLGDSSLNTETVSYTPAQKMVITVGSRTYPFFKVIDPWGRPLRYFYQSGNSSNFPVIESAGPDKKFGTADDIVNRKN